MKRLLLYMVCLLVTALGVQAQSYKLVLVDDIPADAAQVLEQRFTQMLAGGGFTVADEGTPLTVSATVTSREQTGGALGQVALEIDILAAAGEASETFSIKGVGDNDADAWLRAVKQLLPRSKNASNFLEKLK